MSAEYHRARYAAERQNGICHRCQAPTATAAYCESCAALYRERRRKLVAAGFCRSCLAKRQLGDKKHCESCLAARALEGKLRRDRRRAAGLCIRCGRNAAAPKRTSCERCLARVRAAT